MRALIAVGVLLTTLWVVWGLIPKSEQKQIVKDYAVKVGVRLLFVLVVLGAAASVLALFSIKLF